MKRVGMHRLVSLCNPSNTASWKLMERLGLRREGYSKKSVTYKQTSTREPIWWNEYQYAILVEEWSPYACEISDTNGCRLSRLVTEDFLV